MCVCMLLCKSAVSYFVFSSDISLTHFQHTLNSVYGPGPSTVRTLHTQMLCHWCERVQFTLYNKTSKNQRLCFTQIKTKQNKTP